MRHSFLCFAGLSLLVSLPAWARFGSRDAAHDLSHSAGIASPAINTALFENPAGLAYSKQTQISLFGRTQTRNWTPVTGGAQVFFGDDNVGGGLGVSSDSFAQLGLSAGISSLNSVIGASADIDMDDGSTDMNLGLILGPDSTFRFGAAVFGILNGADRLGAGIATELNESATFAIDVGTNGSFDAIGFKPSLGIHLPAIQIIMGYGIDADDANPSWINDGVAVAMGLGLGSKVQLSMYYNQIARYFVALGFKF